MPTIFTMIIAVSVQLRITMLTLKYFTFTVSYTCSTRNSLTLLVLKAVANRHKCFRYTSIIQTTACVCLLQININMACYDFHFAKYVRFLHTYTSSNTTFVSEVTIHLSFNSLYSYYCIIRYFRVKGRNKLHECLERRNKFKF